MYGLRVLLHLVPKHRAEFTVMRRTSARWCIRQVLIIAMYVRWREIFNFSVVKKRCLSARFNEVLLPPCRCHADELQPDYRKHQPTYSV